MSERVRISSHPLHSRWRAMIRRCSEPDHQAWGRYGGRGVSVCDEWVPKHKGDGRRAFLSYVEHVTSLDGYSDDCLSDLELDRVDNESGYEPGNLRWATKSQNQRNRSDNVTISDECGREWSVPEIVKASGIDRGTVHQRIKRGWELQRIIRTPKRVTKRTRNIQ